MNNLITKEWTTFLKQIRLGKRDLGVKAVLEGCEGASQIRQAQHSKVGRSIGWCVWGGSTREWSEAQFC